MVHWIDTGETPWKVASKKETSFLVSGLAQQDVLVAEVETSAKGPLDVIAVGLNEGTNPVESAHWLRYRIHKKAGPNPLPTMVEVMSSA